MYCKDFYLVSEKCTKDDQDERLETAITQCRSMETCSAVLQVKEDNNKLDPNKLIGTASNDYTFTCDAGVHLYALCPEINFNYDVNFQNSNTNSDATWKSSLAQKLRIKGKLISHFPFKFWQTIIVVQSHNENSGLNTISTIF